MGIISKHYIFKDKLWIIKDLYICPETKGEGNYDYQWNG